MMMYGKKGGKQWRQEYLETEDTAMLNRSSKVMKYISKCVPTLSLDKQ